MSGIFLTKNSFHQRSSLWCAATIVHETCDEWPSADLMQLNRQMPHSCSRQQSSTWS